MKHSKILSRVRNGRKLFYCNIGGRQYGLGGSLAEARIEFAKILGKDANDPGEPISVEGMRIGELFILFDKWGKAFSAEKTRADYGYWLRRWVKHVGARKYVDEIRPKHVDTFVIDNGYVGTWTHVKVIRSVRRLFNWAKKQGHLPATMTNPAHGCDSPPAPASPQISLSNQQLRVMMRCGRDFGAAVRFMLNTGCRVEEIRKMDTSHVDTKHRVIVIPWKIAKGGKKTQVDRLIRYPRKLDRFVKRRLKGRAGPLLTSNGKRWLTSTFCSRMVRLRDENQDTFPDGCTGTSIRYTFTTRAIMRGVGPVELAKILGHADLKMLMRHYQKLGVHGDHMQKTLDQAVSRSKLQTPLG
jgi:integrase